MFKSVTIEFYNYNTIDYILWHLYYYSETCIKRTPY